MTPERRPNILILGALIAVLLVLVIFEPSYGWALRRFFTPSNIDAGAQSGVSAAGASTSIAGLLAENDALKAQLAELQSIQAELPTSSPQYLRAMVYSRYPFNFKNELFLDAGTAAGVATGSAVTYEGMLVGRVADVWRHEAAVQTIFDNNFRLPVRVGAAGADGLLTGGSYPYVASIAKTAALATGDIVVSAAQGAPYALPVGEVQSTSTSPDNLFQQAALSFPYDINAVETVLVAKGS